MSAPIEMEQTSSEQEITLGWLVDIRDDMISAGNIAGAAKPRTLISRASKNLRGVKESAFDPQIISIGPLHYKDRKSKFKAMENHKIRFLVRLFGDENRYDEELKELGIIKSQTADTLKNLVEAMRNMEKDTRACYAESFDHISSDDFVRMMLLDGIFVVQLLSIYKRTQDERVDVGEELVDTAWMVRKLQRDLLKLENQLPFFVLEKIHDSITNSGGTERTSLPVLVVTFFNPLLPTSFRYPKEPSNEEEEYNHMLHLFHSTFINQLGRQKDVYNPVWPQCNCWDNCCGCFDVLVFCVLDLLLVLFHRVFRGRDRERRLKPEILELGFMHLTPPLQDLHENGGMMVNKEEELDLLNITFKSGVLNIPRLVLDEDTVPMFLNFVALEECMGGLSPFISYFLLINSLICSESDVEILRKERIIQHSLESNKDVVCLIKELAKKMDHDEGKPYYFHDLVRSMNDYHTASLRNRRVQRKMKWRRWWKDLKVQYFSNPWTILSLLAALVLLILTFLQTFYTLFAYYNPPS